MNRSLLQVYALSVCFATLMCGIVVLGMALYDVVQIAAPAFTMQGHEAYLSNEAYLTYWPDKADRSPEEIAQLRESALVQMQHAERRAALQSLAFLSIILAINAVTFALHWKLVLAERRG